MSHIRVQHTRHYHSRAFTLIELLVVISIIGLLSSVVLAAINGARQKGTIAAGQKFDQHTHSAFYDDLVVSWDFNSDVNGQNRVNDLSGNGNHLAYITASGLNTTPNPSSSGQSFGMNAGGSARTGTAAFPPLSINPANLKNPPTGNFTISFWLYPTSISTAYHFLTYMPLSGTAEKMWRFSYNAGVSGFGFTYFAGGNRTAGLGQLALNTWHHITATCIPGKIAVYVNGRVTATADTAGASCGFVDTPTPLPIEIGSISGNSYTYYLDNVRIYDVALPLATIQGQYFAEASEFENSQQRLLAHEK